MAESKPERHFDDEEFPEHCDHCPAPMGEGAYYRRVQVVLDADDNRTASRWAPEKRSSVEHSFELVLCLSCAERLNHWVRTPLSAAPTDGEVVGELDDASLQDELEKEMFILSDGNAMPPCQHHPKADCGCYCRFVGCAPETCPEDPPPPLPVPLPLPAARPCLDPDQMHGAADQFPGCDYDVEKLL
mgnify:CR=1 FL=1